MTALTVPDPKDLATWGDRKLTNYIKKGHTKAGAHMRGYEQAAISTGLALLEMRGRKGYGEWLPWLKENFDGSRQTADAYRMAAEEWLANCQSAGNLEPVDDEVDTPSDESAVEEVGQSNGENSSDESELNVGGEADEGNENFDPGEDEEFEPEFGPFDPATESPVEEPSQSEGEPEVEVENEVNGYMLVVAAVDAVGKAQGAVTDPALEAKLSEAKKLIKQVVMSLHSATGGIYA